jgi:ABC-type multidrug transport system permease subunit
MLGAITDEILQPFHYLLEGMLGLVIHDIPIRCSTTELAIFSTPPGQTCDSYAGNFAHQAGGYVQTQPNGQCGYCQYSTGDSFGASFSVYYNHLWRNFGFFWAYIAFNFGVVFACSWLYLSGGRKIKGALSLRARRERKIREKARRGGEEKA